MKRGLVVLDPAEIAPAEWAGRVAPLQQRLQQEGLFAALMYGDVYRSGDIAYLSNLCIYWNEGVLAVPARGEPALLTKLSARVHPWMRATSCLQDLRSGPNFGQLAQRYLGEAPPGLLGLVELDWWPAALVDELAAKLPGWQLRDLGRAVWQQRLTPSASEVELLRRGAAAGALGLVAAGGAGLSAAERWGQAEGAIRAKGARDVWVTLDPAPGGGVCLSIRTDFRAYWTEVARVVLPEGGEPAWAGPLATAHAAAAARLAPGVTVDALQAAAAPHLAGLAPAAWTLRCTHHADIEVRGEYRLAGAQEPPLPAGAVVALNLTVTFPDGTAAVQTDTFWVRDGGSERLTAGAPGPGLS